jgi:SOS-response transcriptional repressor LexA
MKGEDRGSDLKRTVARLIFAWREEKGLSQQILAERAGISKNAVSLYERGETSPSIHQIGKICHALNVRLITFFQGPPSFDVDTQIIDAYVEEGEQEGKIDAASVPLFDGIPEGGFQPETAEGVHIMNKTDLHHEDLIIVRIKNGSMAPTLVPDDLVLVDPRVKKPKSGAIVCAVFEGTSIMARFRRRDRNVLLVPDNPRYETIGARRVKDVTILGEVIRLVHRETGLHSALFPM